MSTYFLITSNAWYLMQGGTDLYIDKAEIKDGKVTLPEQWFLVDKNQPFRPNTILVSSDDTTRNPFRDLKKIPAFGFPVSKNIYDSLKLKSNLLLFVKEIYTLSKNFSKTIQNAPNFSTISYPPSYEARATIFPQIIFAEDISSDSTKVGANDPSIGDLYLWVTWLMGLTPRPYQIISSVSEEYNLNFLIRSPSNLSSQPLGIETLEKALIPFPYPDKLNSTELNNILQFMETGEVPEKSSKKDFPGISVIASARLRNQEANLNFSVGEIVTFTQVMDAIAIYFDAEWDWLNNKSAYLIPRR